MPTGQIHSTTPPKHWYSTLLPKESHSEEMQGNCREAAGNMGAYCRQTICFGVIARNCGHQTSKHCETAEFCLKQPKSPPPPP